MTTDEIMKLPIKNVEERHVAKSSAIYIFFDLNGMKCVFSIFYSRDNVYRVSMIAYEDPTIDCPYCNHKENYCSQLVKYRRTIFERVINTNAIRLNWLYRKYTFM